MPIDFKASQIRTNKIIASGSDTKPYLLMYPSSSASDQIGGISNISNTGSDGWLFISGSINGNDKVVFGGDASISGTFVVDPRLSDSLIYASVNSSSILSRVGIKNNSPETTLHIGGTTDPGLLVDTGAIINYGRNNSSSATFLVQSKLGGDHGLLVVSGCCDRVSIGKHNPNAKFDVYGDGIYSGSLTVTGSLTARSITGSIKYVDTTLTTPFIGGDGISYNDSSGQWQISGEAFTRALQTPVWRGVTSGSGQAEIFIDGLLDRYTVPLNSAQSYIVLVSARQRAGTAGSVGDSRWFRIEGAVKNVNGLVSSIGLNTTYDDGDIGTASWDAELQADGTNTALVVKVTGELNKEIDWSVTAYPANNIARTLTLDGQFNWYGSTFDATGTEIFLDGISKRFPVKYNGNHTFSLICNGLSSTGDSRWFKIDGGIKNIAGTTSLVGTTTVYDDGDAGAAAWDISVEADDINDALKISVTGSVATQIDWLVTGYISDADIQTVNFPNDTVTWQGITSGSGYTELFLGGISERFEIPENRTLSYQIIAHGYQISGSSGTIGSSHWFRINGAVKNVTGSVSLLGSNYIYDDSDASASSWDITVDGDDANDSIRVSVLGENNKTIEWFVKGYITDIASLVGIGCGRPSGRGSHVQFNDGGIFGSDSEFTWNKYTSTLTATNITGSLTKLSDGTDYLIAGTGITLTTGSNGAVTIDSMGGVNTLNDAYLGTGTYPGNATGYYINTAYSLSSFPYLPSQDIVFVVGDGTIADDGNTPFGKFILTGYKPTLEIVPGPGPWSSTPGAIRFYEAWNLGSSYTALRAPDSIPSSYTLTLPTNAGLANEVLTTDGTGILSWQTIPGTAEYFLSTTAGSIYTTGSTAFIGGEVGVDSPSDKGSDVFFYVSGSTDDSANALFGGGLVVSGNLRVDGNTTIGDSSTDTFVLSASLDSNIIPTLDSIYTLGTSTNRFAHVYTGDLHLRNDRGDWTILEEREYLCVINNITGKKYKMSLIPLDEE